MAKDQYPHPALSVEHQIALLKEKGLIIQDEISASNWLSHISYFRFKHYSYSFKDYKNTEGHYVPATTFEQVRDLYLFDRKLKMLLFDALENIEISLKTQLSNAMSLSYGPHWYIDPLHFISEQERRQISRNAQWGEDMPKVFDHALFLKDIEAEMKSPNEIFLAFYKKTYAPIFPPSWMMMEIITFGTLSLLFENLKPGPEKVAVCDSFGLTKKQIISWLHCFSFIRNKCAHHARLVYSKVNFAPAMPQKKSRQFLAEADLILNDSLYAVLCCIQYMLAICNDKASFKMSLRALIESSPSINYNRLGFTPHWKEEQLWS